MVQVLYIMFKNEALQTFEGETDLLVVSILLKVIKASLN
jgi:hypothetical protein